MRIVDHARADHGADGLAGDHASAIERGDGASRFAAPISRIRAGLQIHDLRRLQPAGARRECEVIVRLLREAAQCRI